MSDGLEKEKAPQSGRFLSLYEQQIIILPQWSFYHPSDHSFFLPKRVNQ